MRCPHAVAGPLVLLAAVACASTGEPGTSRGMGDVITAEELGTIQVSNALEAVQRLRPQFLRHRGTATLRNAGPEGQSASVSGATGTELVVYIDGVRGGGIDVLRNIGIQTVSEIRYVNARDATTLYGTGHIGGVIEVKTRQ